MRDQDDVLINSDDTEILLSVREGPVPGIHTDVKSAGVRLTVQEALDVIGRIKKQIKYAVDRS